MFVLQIDYHHIVCVCVFYSLLSHNIIIQDISTRHKSVSQSASAFVVFLITLRVYDDGIFNGEHHYASPNLSDEW